MKTIFVVAAIIQKDGKYFATQRGYGEYKDGWEFPGGKIEQGETPEQALVREIREELNTTIKAEGERAVFETNVPGLHPDLITVDCDYTEFHLNMQCFLCHIENGPLQLLEAEASRWLTIEELDSVDWLQADLQVVEALKKHHTLTCHHSQFLPQPHTTQEC